MTENSRPWDGITLGDATTAPYSADEWSQYWGKLAGFGAFAANRGIVKGNAAAPAATYTYSGLDVLAASPASANVVLKSGAALVQGTQYENTADITLAVAANNSGNPRVDTVILRKDYVLQTIRSLVKQGTPAVTPTAPTLTQTPGVTWEIPIADIAVANGFVTIVQANITPRNEYANIPDAVFIDNVQNNSGGELVTGDVVIWQYNQAAGTRHPSVTTTTTRANPYAAGVWVGRTANGGYGRVQIKGVGLVNTDPASTAIGSLVTSGTVKVADGLGISLNARFPTTTIGELLESRAVGGNLRLAYINVQHAVGVGYIRIAQGSVGVFNSGSWVRRTLDTNQLVTNMPVAYSDYMTIGAGGNAGKVTLKSGLYVLRGWATGYACGTHQTRLYNYDTAAAIAYGAVVTTGAAVCSVSLVEGILLAQSAGVTIGLEHQCSSNGQDGLASPFAGASSVSAVLEIYRVGDELILI